MNFVIVETIDGLKKQMYSRLIKENVSGRPVFRGCDTGEVVVGLHAQLLNDPRWR